LVVRLAKFGAFVELEPAVEGLCHSSQIPGRGPGRRAELERGRRYQFEIIKVDELDRRIGLRCVSPEPIE
jgi:ribosomal protein S1